MLRRSIRDHRIAPATAGALVIHVALGYCGAKLTARSAPDLDDSQPTPRLTIVDVELAPTPSLAEAPAPSTLPPGEPTAPGEPLPPSVRPPADKPRTNRKARPTQPQAQSQPEPEGEPVDDAAPPTASAPVISAPDVGVGATGVRATNGFRATTMIGGAGADGSGAGGPIDGGGGTASIATIKTRAMPRGDFAYSLVKDYPSEAKQLGIEGKIRVKLIVDERGAVTAATLLNRLGYGLDEQAARRAKELIFDPARDTNDQPVRSVVIWTFEFTLPK